MIEAEEHGKEEIISEQLYKLGDEVIYDGELCKVTAVEDGGGAFVTDSVMNIGNKKISGHSQRLRLRSVKHGNEMYPISGANVKLAKTP